MDLIFHEKQDGSLCAQHCLNALLQGPYYTPFDLATIAQELDEAERERMLEGGIDSQHYQQFLQEGSVNYDDSGYFSVQVIAKALSAFSLDLIPYNSQNAFAVLARRDPISQQAYICHYRHHWFTIRRIGRQWFNLNSLLSGPDLITDTYLSLFLAQLQAEGYSIFLVIGHLEETEADRALISEPAIYRPRPSKKKKRHLSDDPELAHALDVSQQLSDEEDEVGLALAMSMEATPSSSSSSVVRSTEPSQEELRKKRLQYLEKNNKQQTESAPDQGTADESEEEELQKAMNLSMQSS